MMRITALVVALLLITSARADDVAPPPIDFSTCGYAGADVMIPNVPIRAVVTPAGGDMTARIQAGIDYVASLPLDEHGICGAVLLQKGRYEVSGKLKLNTSGVVLRGSGAGEGGTTLFAAGLDRRTLITVAGKDDRRIDEAATAIADASVPVNATTFRVADAGRFKAGDAVIIRRPCTAEWIKALGMDDMGGERHGFTWKPGTRELVWDRTISKIAGDVVTINSPLTTAIESEFGGGTIAKYTWPGRISQVGVENIRLESAFDPANPKDENHAWFAITMENVQDAWVRQATMSHFAGGAVAAFESCRRVTVEDCKSLAPVSEIGGHRRHTFFTGGQQTLFQRCCSEQGRHDFSIGFCAAGPNAFVQCEAKEALDDSGPIDSWASGVLFDNVRIDGNALTFADRRYQAQGAGWSAANCVLWQCHAAVIRCFAPPTASNWAVGCWATFDGNGTWQSSNESVNPPSLYYAQLANRIGNAAMERAQLVAIASDASSSPSPAEAAERTAAAKEPGPQMSLWVDQAAKRNPIPVEIPSSGVISDVPPKVAAKSSTHPISIRNGVVVCDDAPLTGGTQGVMWWRGSIRPFAIAQNTPSVTRFVPGRDGPGFTDDLEQLAIRMRSDKKIALDHNYGLWYDRRRDDHERVRRMTGDVWPPFFEQPFARSGQGVAWDGLSKYDLTKYNPWYWDRLRNFADLGDQHGLVLLYQHYFQHNILEAGAHYADFPWRTANNINDTGFPEPPPYAGDKRIFLAEQFYDLTNPRRRELHRAFIRQGLNNFADNSNVIHFTGAEFTGPLHFVEFWLDTIADWKQETGKHPLIGLSATKDVQDAILADPARAKIVDCVDIRYWWYQADGAVYAPPGGQNLAPRQQARVFKPKPSSPEQVERAVREYRTRFPGKAVMYSADGAERFGAAAFKGGASLAQK